ncbi:hypothetical protein THAOC_27062, partial [Thalassiosira oceanica]
AVVAAAARRADCLGERQGPAGDAAGVPEQVDVRPGTLAPLVPVDPVRVLRVAVHVLHPRSVLRPSWAGTKGPSGLYRPAASGRALGREGEDPDAEPGGMPVDAVGELCGGRRSTMALAPGRDRSLGVDMRHRNKRKGTVAASAEAEEDPRCAADGVLLRPPGLPSPVLRCCCPTPRLTPIGRLASSPFRRRPFFEGPGGAENSAPSIAPWASARDVRETRAVVPGRRPGGRRAYNLAKASFPVGYQAGPDDSRQEARSCGLSDKRQRHYRARGKAFRFDHRALPQAPTPCKRRERRKEKQPSVAVRGRTMGFHEMVSAG